MFGICEELFPIFLHKKFAKFFLSAVDKMCGVLFLVPYKFLVKNGNFLHFLSYETRIDFLCIALCFFADFCR